MNGESFWGDFVSYVGRMSQFERVDWKIYLVWIGLMVGLLTFVTGFIGFGWWNGVEFPAYVWSVPLGTFIFVVAIAIDTIGHRTAYFEAISQGENLVHHITIAAGISGTVLLCAAYSYPDALWAPAICLIALSVFYSIIDEAMHWIRYAKGGSDRIEMWSHFFIFVGHTIMMASWVAWFARGYPGVAETLRLLL